MRPPSALTALERVAWQRLAEAEQAVHEAREYVIRITNLEHARRTHRLRLVSPTRPGLGLKDRQIDRP
jgi:hypothetical protein